MSAGMAYEAMNNAGAARSRLIVILNDNDMSIAPPVGGMSAYLSRMVSSEGYTTLRNFAKQLAKTLGVPFLRFDMSEYMEKHAVARLIGAPPGYVGYDEGGMLVERIRKQPHAVLLLDEIEKAHRDLFDILLQVMDHATLTDNHGREADFRHVILVMTSNVGARDLVKPAIGFAGARKTNKSEVEKLFSPEFRNRLDEIVSFGPLTPEVMGRVVDKFVREVEAQLKDKKVTIALTDAARSWLAEKGYDPDFGARPMARVIQTERDGSFQKLFLDPPPASWKAEERVR